MPALPSCAECQEPVAPMARACPHCRRSTLADLLISAPVADSRVRYQVARALSALPGAPGVSAAQAALAEGGRLLGAALPGLAQACAAILAERGVAHSLEPASSSSSRSAAVARGGGARLALVAAALVAALAGAYLLLARPRATPRASSTGAAARLTGAQVAERALPSTVLIRCAETLGSGFFVAPGRILTNAHVACPPGEDMKIRLPRGREGSGQVLRRDERLDLALVEVEGISAPPLPLGDAGALKVGDRVVVVGSPKGMEFSVTQGSVSNLERVFMGVAMIQTDAPINPGNSGGPMLDERGLVVGVVSLKRQDAEGISLALPVNYAFTGAQALVALPVQGESEGFGRMAARADAADNSEAAKLQATGQRPGLVAAHVEPSNQTIVAEVLWPSAVNPGPRSFDFQLVRGAHAPCSLQAEVSEWLKMETEEGGPVLKPQVKEWLDRHGFSSDMWATAVTLSFSHCSDEVLGSGVRLRMQGADDDASEIRIRG